MPPNCLFLEVLWEWAAAEDTREDPGGGGGDYIFQLASERAEDSAEEGDMWAALLTLLSLWPQSGQAIKQNGWMDGC